MDKHNPFISFRRVWTHLSVLGVLLCTTAWATGKTQQINLPLPPQVIPPSKPIPKQQQPTLNWTQVKIRSGDTLTRLFQTHGLPITQALESAKAAPDLITYLKPGHILSWQLDQQGVKRIRYPANKDLTITLTRKNQAYTRTETTTQSIKTLGYEHIQIKQSLFKNTRYLPVQLQHDLNQMFAGQLNLARSIHPGSTIDMLYEIYYINGKRNRTGHVVAALLYNGNTTFSAFYYKNSSHQTRYYTENGQSVGRRFLAFPLKFTRVSSRFSHRRYDPVTHRIHSHLGVDLAAPTGTKIHSIGDGKITSVGVHGGYGKAVYIQYGQYTALYAHLSHYRHGLHAGMWVHKGDVIGYVGQTGWATGHHLHFGFYDHHKAINWLSFHPPPAGHIPTSELTKFQQYSSHLLAEVMLYQGRALAINNTNSRAHHE